MARKIATGIDIGTHQIKVAVVEGAKSQDGSNMANVIGTGTASSKGLRHGRITNASDVTKSIRAAIVQAEKTSKLRIKKVFLSIGGIGLETIIAKGSVMISKADSEITDLDVKKVLAVAESEIPKSALVNKEIIHSIPRLKHYNAKNNFVSHPTNDQLISDPVSKKLMKNMIEKV